MRRLRNALAACLTRLRAAWAVLAGDMAIARTAPACGVDPEVFARVRGAVQWGDHEFEPEMAGQSIHYVVEYQVLVWQRGGERATVLGPRYATAVGVLAELEKRRAQHPHAFIGRVITAYDLSDPGQRRAFIRAVGAGDREALRALQ